MSVSGVIAAVDNHQLVRLDENAVVTVGPTDRDSPTQAFEPSFGGVEVGAQEVVWAESPRQHVPGTSLLRFSPDLGLLSEAEINPSDTFEYSDTQYGNCMCASADGSKLYLFRASIIGDGETYQIIEVDSKTGAILRRLTPTAPTQSGHFVPVDGGHSSGTAGFITLSDDGTKLFYQAISSVDHSTDVVGVLDIASGVESELSWTVTTIDDQISALSGDASYYILQSICGAVELPGGDLLIMGIYGTFARVKQADGALVKSYNCEPWGGRLTSNSMYGFGICLSYKKDAFWVSGEGDPQAMGIRVPPPPFVPDEGDYAGIVAKIDLASGATVGYATMFQYPYQIWPFHVPPVLTLGEPTARVVIRGT